MAQQNPPEQATGTGLLICSTDQAPRVLAEFLKMFLGYRYGLKLVEEKDVVGAAVRLKARSEPTACVFLIQDREIGSRTTVAALSRSGAIPLFFFVPPSLVESMNELCAGMGNVFVLDWEKPLSRRDPGLTLVIESAFVSNRIRPLLDGAADLPYAVLRERVALQISHLETLPALPDLLVRLIRLVRDPEAKIEDLEGIVSSDPSIVWKLMAVMRSPAFVGRRRSDWTLREVIMRLGLKKVGTIVQQVVLMNSFVKPQASVFDLRRFWEHSVGCALVADRLYTTQAVSVGKRLPFDDYWLAALLHDMGKLVLGLFFPTHFTEVTGRLDPSGEPGQDFFEVEAELGCAGLHEEIARLLLLKVDAGPSLVEGVGNHHGGVGQPSHLGALVHVSDNLCKDLGVGYLPEERGVYNPAAMKMLKVTESGIRRIEESLGESMLAEIKEVVDHCLASEPREQARPRTARPPETAAGAGKALRDRLRELLPRMRARLDEDTELEEGRKGDLLVDIEAMRAQLQRTEITPDVLRALMDSPGQAEPLRDLIREMGALLDQLEALSKKE